MWHQWITELFFCLFSPFLSSKQMNVWNLMIIPCIYLTAKIQDTLTCRTLKVGKLIDWLVCLFIHPSFHPSTHHPSIKASIRLPAYLPTHPSVHVRLPITHPSIQPALIECTLFVRSWARGQGYKDRKTQSYSSKIFQSIESQAQSKSRNVQNSVSYPWAGPSVDFQ